MVGRMVTARRSFSSAPIICTWGAKTSTSSYIPGATRTIIGVSSVAKSFMASSANPILRQGRDSLPVPASSLPSTDTKYSSASKKVIVSVVPDDLFPTASMAVITKTFSPGNKRPENSQLPLSGSNDIPSSESFISTMTVPALASPDNSINGLSVVKSSPGPSPPSVSISGDSGGVLSTIKISLGPASAAGISS